MDWSAGILACMSVASTREGLRISTLDAAEAAALQAGMPKLQSLTGLARTYARPRTRMVTNPTTLMAKSNVNLGPLLSSHGTSPATLQRAAIVTILSFLFFLSMLLVFYARQQMVYFVLSTAFLVVYIFTMIGWVMQKRNVVSVYENGITYRKFSSTWDELQSVKADPASGISLMKTIGESVTIPQTVAGLPQILEVIKSHLAA